MTPAAGADDGLMFDSAGQNRTDRHGPLGTFEALHICRSCRSELVQLVDHEDAGDGFWQLHLRCPECHSTMSGRVPDARCAELDEELERGTHQLLDTLLALQREQMEAEADAFVAALSAGLLLPEDF